MWQPLRGNVPARAGQRRVLGKQAISFIHSLTQILIVPATCQPCRVKQCINLPSSPGRWALTPTPRPAPRPEAGSPCRRGTGAKQARASHRRLLPTKPLVLRGRARSPVPRPTPQRGRHPSPVATLGGGCGRSGLASGGWRVRAVLGPPRGYPERAAAAAGDGEGWWLESGPERSFLTRLRAPGGRASPAVRARARGPAGRERARASRAGPARPLPGAGLPCTRRRPRAPGLDQGGHVGGAGPPLRPLSRSAVSARLPGEGRWK